MSYVKPSLSRKSINCSVSGITLDGDSGYPNSLSETVGCRKAHSQRPTVNQRLHANTSKTLLPDKWWFLMLGWCHCSEFNRGHTLLFTDSKCCRGSISYLLLCHNTHFFSERCAIKGVADNFSQGFKQIPSAGPHELKSTQQINGKLAVKSHQDQADLKKKKKGTSWLLWYSS